MYIIIIIMNFFMVRSILSQLSVCINNTLNKSI